MEKTAWSFALLDELNRRITEHRFLVGAVLAAVAFVVFSGSLANGFVYDDNPQILQNAFILNPHLWKQIFTGSVWSFQGARTNFYRPLQFACYWILYRIGGPNPALFHLLNLVVYAVSVWLVYKLARALFKNDVVALAGALLWALHPVHVEAVTWISALPDVGFAFFMLLSLLCFIRAEQGDEKPRKYHALAALAFFAALFFKEMALGFPVLLLAYWFFLGRPESWLRRAVRWSPYVAAEVIYLVVRQHALGYVTQASLFGKTPLRVIATAIGLLGDNTRILFWPVHLNVYRMFDLGPSLRSPWPWITLLVIAGTFWLRKREPCLAFLIAWWPVTLLPVLDVRQLSFPLLADRFLYFPSIGPCLAVAYLLFEWLPRRVPQRKLAPAAACVLGTTMFLCAAQTVRAIPHWRDNKTLISYSLTQSPNCPLLHMVKGMELEYQYDDLQGALKQYNTARRLNQQSSWPLNLDHDYYLAVGRIALLEGNRKEAVRDFEKSQRAAPDSSHSTDALGAVYFPMGQYEKAARYFEQSIKIDRQDVGAHFYLGTCWMKLGRDRDAAEQFRAARKIDPHYWQAYQAEAKALNAAGETAEAERIRSLIKKP